MEETNFVLLWKEHYEKIDQSLAINKLLLKELISQKAKSAVKSLKLFKFVGIVLAVVYLFVLGTLISIAVLHYSSAANYFIFSMTAIFFINAKALYDYIKHLAWAGSIDYNGSVTAIQEKLARLEVSIFKHTSSMFLQLPFWTTFYLSNKWFPQNVGGGYILFQCLLTAIFTWLAYWLYKNIKAKNADKKWVRILFNGSGGKHVSNALGAFKELEQFKLE